MALSVVPSPNTSSNAQADKDDRHLMAGLSTGVLSIRTRLSGAVKQKQKTREREMSALAAGTIDQFDASERKKRKLTQGHRARLRGVDYSGFGAELVVEGDSRSKKRKIALWDRLLRKMEYGRALEEALVQNDLVIVITCLKALVHRSALPTAVHGLQDAGKLGMLVRWVRGHVCDARDVGLLSRVGLLATGVWAEGLGTREMRGELDWRGEVKGGKVEGEREVMGLHRAVREQVDVCQEAAKTCGMLDMLMIEAGDGGMNEVR